MDFHVGDVVLYTRVIKRKRFFRNETTEIHVLGVVTATKLRISNCVECNWVRPDDVALVQEFVSTGDTATLPKLEGDGLDSAQNIDLCAQLSVKCKDSKNVTRQE